MLVKSIQDIPIREKRVFFRFDFNVPLDESCRIKDDTRLVRALPTLRYALGEKARCILASHLGRPKGQRVAELSLKPVAGRLSELLEIPVAFADDCVGPEVETAARELLPGGILLLENLRFHAEETKNDEDFSRKLASLADVYVNDAFGTAHRAHASTVGIARFVKEKAAGLLLKEELESLARALSNPARPVAALFGGAKVSDKIAILRNIVDRMDSLLIGGGMANTFLRAKGLSVGASKVEEEMLPSASEIMAEADKKGCRVLLPEDVVTAKTIEEGAQSKVVDVASVPGDEMALDIGPKTIGVFREAIGQAGTIVWNGPMGVFEIEAFRKGTTELAVAVAEAPGFSLVGGGDSIRALKTAGVAGKISYISTGGGAFMEFMEGKTLPGVAALED
ncbi:MAG: phosphoglycerate kinase [Thermodesulfobacteriota bacterium]